MRSRSLILCFLSASLAWPAIALAGRAPRGSPVSDCRSEPASPDAPRPGHARFPDGDLFGPPLADVKEPRFSLSYRRVRFLGDAGPAGNARQAINAGIGSAGGIIGLWARRSAGGCDGVQVNLIVGIFSQFDLDAPSQDLINSDFVIGTQLSTRRGRLAARTRLLHQSSHLGDEFVLRNPQIVRDEFGFQAIDGLVSYDADRWRVYGGGGYLFFIHDALDPWALQSGVEIRNQRARRGTFHPVAAVDINALQSRNWRVTTSAAAGFAWASPTSSRNIRALLVGLNGHMPFGQFSRTQRLRNVGLQFQFEF